MSLFSEKLAALPPGSRVRFTHVSGQVIEGVVSENDGKESLSVRITSVATLRYDQIGMMEEYGQAAADALTSFPEIQQPAPSKPEINVMKIAYDKGAVSQAFKAMDTKEKSILRPVHDKYQSYLRSHDLNKCREAADLTWKLIDENIWDYNPRVNMFYGLLQMVCGEYEAAAESFSCAENIRYAYCAAYQCADADHPEACQAAAAFAAVYLTSAAPAEPAEAAEVLRKTAETAKDASGIQYAAEHITDAETKEIFADVLCSMLPQSAQGDSGKEDLPKLAKELCIQYPGTEIQNRITEYLQREGEAEPQPAGKTHDLSRQYTGRLTEYNMFERTGTIVCDDGERLAFDLKDVTDVSLSAQIKKITTKTFSSIPVKFMLMKSAGTYSAVFVKRVCDTAKPVPPQPVSVPVKQPVVQEERQPEAGSMEAAAKLYLQKDYTGAIRVYKQHLNGEDWENAFFQIVMCYLALSNDGDELGYLEELSVFVAKYADKPIKNSKTLEALQQYYMKARDYEKGVRVLNDLIERCDPAEHGKILHYLAGKARCYRMLKDYPSAVSELLGWLDIVKRNKLKERQQQRDTLIYIELAEMYFECGDYSNAEKYAKLAAPSERKQALMEKLEEAAPVETQQEGEFIAEHEEDADDVITEPEESLQTAYESYTDAAGFEAIGLDDAAVISTAFGFQAAQLPCLLTYLECAARLSAQSQMQRVNENGETVFVGQVLKTVNTAVSYAFNSPLTGNEHLSSEIMAVFEEAGKILPAISPALFAASSLYTLFNTPSVPDYHMGDLSVMAEAMALEQYPPLLPLLGDLTAFREKTGYGMDAFADYKTGSAALESVIAEAKDCCMTADMRNDVYESQGQVRRMREMMFSDEKSELRHCLNIVAENNTAQYSFVKKTVCNLFIRLGKEPDIDNLDIKKLDRYIDDYWNQARDIIQSEGRHIGRPHDKIKGRKRTNIIVSIRRILSCICVWLSAAGRSSGYENAYAEAQYEALKPKVTTELSGLIECCTALKAEKGFDWGVEAVRLAAEELLAKMDGSYHTKARKYFFIDFLRGEDILLDDNYLPELQSTFCGLPAFNILSRIAHHASVPHPSLPERLSEILSSAEEKHNFRSAEIIRAYGAEMGIAEITEHKDLPQYNACLKLAKQRFENAFQDFSGELELDESYGKLSNINGEKDAVMAIAYAWYRITRITNDYGFYVRLLETIRQQISENAAEKGAQLMRLLDELTAKKFDFGTFSPDMIRAMIDDQNYTAAEYICSCIMRSDVSEIFDYTVEPFGYFREFISEHATNYRAVRGAGKDIADTIFEYSGKKDLELALMHLTNNARKETKGGANLIKSWIPVGGRWGLKGGGTAEEHLERLLSKLGFKPVSIQRDESIDAEGYQVFCRKQTGKVNYVHQIPAFGSKSETEGFRVLCLYGKYDCDMLMDKFREVNSAAKNTLVLLDFAMNVEERRRLARKIKEEKSFAKTFIVVDRVILFYLAKHYTENTVIKRLMAVTLPFAYYQPFVEASSQEMPPELFTGRAAELTSIESAEGANLVYGGRQLGKSALLKMARHNIDRNGCGARAVLLDIRDRTAAEAAKIVCDQLIIEGILEESCRCDTWDALAGHLQKRLMDENPETRITYLLLMLDEADVFIKTGDETDDHPITALKRLPSGKFKLVMAGLHNLSRYDREVMHGNSNYIHLNSVVIKQFRREEATKLLTSILAYLGFRFTQKIIDNILASTYNYPGLIQFYCQKLLEAMKNEDYAGYSESGTPPYEVTESHYKKVLSDTVFTDKVNEKLEATLFTEEKGHSNYHIIALIIAYLCYTDPNDKGYTSEMMLRIAGEYRINRLTSLKPEQLSEILSEMCDLNVITVMEGCYRFSTDGFRKLLGSQEKVEKSMAEYIEEAAYV